MANWAELKQIIANAIKTNGNQEITGQTLQTTLTQMASASEEDNASVKNSISLAGPRFNYWDPCSEPELIIGDSVDKVKYKHLTIVDVVGSKVYSNLAYSGVTIDIPKLKADKSILIYAKIINSWSLRVKYCYASKPYPENNTSYYEQITNPTNVVLLALLENNKIENLLAAGSWSHNNRVPSLSTEIYKEHCRAISLRNSFDNKKALRGLVGEYTTKKVGLRLDSEYLLTRVSKVYVRGKLTNTLNNTVTLYVSDPSVYGQINLFSKNLTVDGEGNFEDTVYIPDSVFDAVNWDYGYNIFVFHANTKDNVATITVHEAYAYNHPFDTDLFNKVKLDISGSIVGNSFNIRVVSGDILKEKIDFIYIKGRIRKVSGGAAPAPMLCVTYPVAQNYKDIWSTYIRANSDGTFDTYVAIPSNIFDDVDFNIGYTAFVFAYNNTNTEINLTIESSYAVAYTGKEHTISSYKDMSKLIDIKYTNAFGHIAEAVLPLHFQEAGNSDVYCTAKNSQASESGYIAKIIADVNFDTPRVADATFYVKIGLLDQRNRFVVSREFAIRLHQGYNEVDIEYLKIPIAVGEQIAISVAGKPSIVGTGYTGTATLKYAENDNTNPNEMLYGTLDDAFHTLDATYGGAVTLAYTVKTVESIFASSSEIAEVKTLVEKQNDAINTLQYVYDENNIPYKIIVRNGQLELKEVGYKKVLALGNSLTSHEYKDSIGYYGDDSWAMASTNKVVTTWTNHLQTILRQKNPNAVVTPFNIFPWEENYMGADLSELFKNHVGIDYDLIIMRAGENGTAGSDYAQGVDRLITYLRENFPTADIIMSDMFWHNATKETGFKQIAQKYNYGYVTVGAISDRCLLGQMLLGRDDEFHPITHSGVAGHCTDVCFFDYANILAKFLGYETITGKYTVNVVSFKDYSINQTSQIKDGYVTILTYDSSQPSITVTKAGSPEEISTQVFNLSGTVWINRPSKVPTYAVVFKMPDGHVDVKY